jgi:D-ribulokinase
VIERLFGRDRLGLLPSGLRPDRPTGLDYYPLVDPGERFPVNDAELAQRLEPRPSDEGDFFQGVLEGIAEIEALAYRRLRELGAPPLRSVRSVGSAAANAGWTRIRERVLSVPLERALSQQACDGVARLVLRHAQIPA